MTGKTPEPPQSRKRSRMRLSQFAVVPASAVLDRSLTPAQKTTLQVVCLHANRDGWCWAKFETMAEELGVEAPQVSKMIAALVSAGYLERHVRTHEARRRVFLRVIYDRPASTLEDVDPAEVAEDSVSFRETLDENVTFHDGMSPAVEVPTGKPPVSLVETHFIEHTKEQKLPTTAARAPADETQGLDAVFTHEAHREAYRAVRKTQRFADSFDASLRTVHTPITGGEAYTWEVIGAALLEVRGNGETFNVSRLRGYCRSIRAGAPAPMRRGAASGEGSVELAPGVTLTPTRFWDLCRESGLTAAMLTKTTVGEIIGRLVATGEIGNGVAFASLVMHVQPWSIAEIKFPPEQQRVLAERLASWPLRDAQHDIRLTAGVA